MPTVWNAWTNPENILRWWAPNGVPVKIHSHDFREGGDWKYILQMPDNTEFISHGVFKTIKPPTSMDKTAVFGNSMKEVNIQLRLEEMDGKTFFTFTVIHPSIEECKQHASFFKGFGVVLDRVDTLLTQR